MFEILFDCNLKLKINYFPLIIYSFLFFFIFLGSYRLLARHLSNSENCQSLNWSDYLNFLKRNSVGKFLSRGACKDVFCIKNAKGGLEAVSGALFIDFSHHSNRFFSSFTLINHFFLSN